MGTALVVVDMLNDFVDGVLANPAAPAIVPPIAELARDARAERDWVVVYCNNAHRPGDTELTAFPPHAMVGTPGAAVVDELRPEPSDLVVPKRFYSGFTRTDLHATLCAREVDRLVLAGQHTDCCIRHTCYDAFVRDYGLTVCTDATTVYEPADQEPVEVRQERALRYLATYYSAQLVPSTEVA